MFDPIIIISAILMGLSLGLLGSGGSILTVPLLVFIAHEPEKIAIAESLLIVGVVAIAGGITQIIKRNVDFKLVGLFGVPSMIAAYAGAYISQYVSAQLQMTLFAIIMLVASVFMLRPIKPVISTTQSKEGATNIKLMLAGSGVGVLAGLVGVGGGFLIVPALLIIARISMRRAIASSLLIIAMQSFAGFGKYAYLQATQNLTYNIPLILLVTTCALVGIFLGSWVVEKLPQERLKQVFGSMLIPLSVFILVRNL